MMNAIVQNCEVSPSFPQLLFLSLFIAGSAPGPEGQPHDYDFQIDGQCQVNLHLISHIDQSVPVDSSPVSFRGTVVNVESGSGDRDKHVVFMINQDIAVNGGLAFLVDDAYNIDSVSPV